MIYLLLFWEFFQTGLFAIGGGLATLPFLQSMAERYTWFTSAELTRMIAIAESTPGPIGVNMATYAGFHTAGILGALVATFALVLPSVVIIIIVARVLQKFRQNKLVDSGFYGLRPAVTGMIAAAAFSVAQLALLSAGAAGFFESIRWIPVVMFAVLLFAMFKFKAHPVVYIAAAAAAGILFKL